MAGQVAGYITHEEQQRRNEFAENEWQRRIERALEHEPGLVAETAAQLKGIDGDVRLSNEGKAEQRQAILAHYSEALAGIDARCAEVLDQEQAEAEAVLARPLGCLTNDALAGQGRLIELYGRSMSASELVAKMRDVLAHGEPSAGAAWCELVPATLRAMEADTQDPMQATSIMSARMEAERLAAEFVDAKAPSKPKARERLAAVKQWRDKIAVHRLARLEYPDRHHRAFGSLPGHNLQRFGQ